MYIIVFVETYSASTLDLISMDEINLNVNPSKN
jgi:hypothetical protein